MTRDSQETSEIRDVNQTSLEDDTTLHPIRARGFSATAKGDIPQFLANVADLIPEEDTESDLRRSIIEMFKRAIPP